MFKLFFAFEPSSGSEPKRKKDRFLTLYDSPRFPRTVWERFRERATANGEAWVDVLREFMENHGSEEGPKKDE